MKYILIFLTLFWSLAGIGWYHDHTIIGIVAGFTAMIWCWIIIDSHETDLEAA